MTLCLLRTTERSEFLSKVRIVRPILGLEYTATCLKANRRVIYAPAYLYGRAVAPGTQFDAVGAVALFVI